MPTVLPYIPQKITVHLGAPSVPAQNVTVSFVDYIKNVASSEIYPTWEENALRTNILAIISFALNRMYTEFYRSRGYNFDITNSTAYDQFFVYGRSYFTNISRLADELFDDYLRRPGFVEPLAAKFCNGTTAVCDGLSQWGSQRLAQQGYSVIGILRYYYGNVEIVTNAPIRNYTSSYPGSAIRRGNIGPYVVVIQTELNRISQNYPAIPKIYPIDGIFGEQTEASVRRFQQIFNLAPDGIVGSATWYALVRLYTAVTNLSELHSQGQTYYSIGWANRKPIQQGDRGIKVEQLQYMLRVLSSFIPEIQDIAVDGIFGNQTKRAVMAAQRWFGLEQTGIVNDQTWNEVFNQFLGIENTSLKDFNSLPYTSNLSGGKNFRSLYSTINAMEQFPGTPLLPGTRDSD